ncbi:MAG: hypothetical protein DMG39_10895 [Acidobacteria bacterium]|nr:MAG: hypothetical protein DMG39_10895 [Acidobacteriota bacterium]
MSTARKQRLFCLFVFFLLFFEGSPENCSYAQAPEDKPASAAPAVRPCDSRQESPKPARKDKTKGKNDADSKEFAPACLEAKDSPLGVQEFFQSYIRTQAWRFGEEKIVADGWIVARYLDKDELLQFAKEGRFAGHVTWNAGKAVVVVTTRDLGDSYTRVEVSARIQGSGQNVDRFAPARDLWNLNSSGALEKTLIAALEDHCKSLRSSPPN